MPEQPQSSPDQKKAEELLHQTQLIVENSYDAILGTTLNGIITSWNGGATTMFGYSAQEVIGKSITILLPTTIKNKIPSLLSKIKLGWVIADYDSVRLRKNGSKIDVAISISPVKTKDGTIIGASIVERDITQRKQSEERIKELSDVRSKFIDIIAHQLRTPIGAVNWNLEALLNGDFGKMEETQYKFLQVTHKASVEITHRIHDLLTAIDIEEERVTLEKGEVALDNIVKAIINEMTEKCSLKNIACQYTTPEKELPTIEGDSEKMRTAVSKLMDNACMYTKENGKITARLAVAGDAIRFEVSDTGVGIPAPEQHRVFTRFFRASNASIMQPDAFGLGLFIAKSFISQHSGKIGFKSTEGKGSTFWFDIPLKRYILQ